MKKFSIDFSFLILLGIIGLSPKQDILLKLILALFLHELGHILWILLFRYKIEHLRLSIFGFFLKLEHTKEEWVEDLLIYSGGILMNLICFLCVPDPVFQKINLLLLIFNLLPIYPLDGFQVIRSSMAYFMPYRLVLKGTAILSLAGSTLVFVFLILFKMDLFLIFNACYLFFLSLEYYGKSNVIFQSFLLKKTLYPYSYPLKEIQFPKNIDNSFYKYHQVNLLIGNKKVTEEELIQSKKLLK